MTTKRKPAKSVTLEEERKNRDRHFGLARTLRSPHIGSGAKSPGGMSSFPRAPHCTLRALPACQAMSQRRQRYLPRVALVDVPGVDELGSAITLPQIEPDADLDADEPDTDNEGIDGAKERLVGVAAAGLVEATSEGQTVRRDRKETVQLWAEELGRRRLVLGGGSGQDWSEGRGDERTGEARQTRTLDGTETLHHTETIAHCNTQIATQFPPVNQLVL
ncbi:hypothetical protein B0H13DRAFT_1928933 [Mycena leptocephala]|nr:hypothetical protein B0H13DRAFT_1928933 [Mycena leptocephala]